MALNIGPGSRHCWSGDPPRSQPSHSPTRCQNGLDDDGQVSGIIVMDGITLADDEAAIAYAERMVRELKENEGHDAPDLQMFVKKES